MKEFQAWLRCAKGTIRKAFRYPSVREPLRAPKLDTGPGKEIAIKVVEFEQAAARNRAVVGEGEQMRALLSRTLSTIETGGLHDAQRT